jgi:hypothetical protein
MIRRFAVFSLLCASLAGCDGLLGSDEPPTGAYALDVNSPVVLRNGDVRIHILQDVLTLKSDGTARRVASERIDYGSDQFRDTTYSVDHEYLYRARGSRIELESACGPAALCAAPPHVWGRATDEGMELQMLYDPDVLLRYRRVSGGQAR